MSKIVLERLGGSSSQELNELNERILKALRSLEAKKLVLFRTDWHEQGLYVVHCLSELGYLEFKHLERSEET